MLAPEKLTFWTELIIATFCAIVHLEKVGAMVDLVEHEIAAEEVRSAVSALKQLVGEIGVEDVLDDIFSSFCIGK